MLIAFYAPLKAPTHPVPSGDRRVARLLIEALELSGHRVELASSLRGLDRTGNPEQQLRIQAEGRAEADRLIRQWREQPAESRPALWFTYHLYYKAPDWIGPTVCRELGIPYVLCEASLAPKRAGGPWRLGHEAVADAIVLADLLLAPTPEDVACLEALGQAERIHRLPPFLDPMPFARARGERKSYRAKLGAAHQLDLSQPWLLAVGMMRQGDKFDSYVELARCLAALTDLPWQLLVVGDGDTGSEVRELIEGAVPGRARFLGLLEPDLMPGVYAASDVCVWPAVNEAYGMALLEAQASGLPVVASAVRGVPEVVRHGATGLLVPGGDPRALAQALRDLLTDPQRRAQLSATALAFVREERSIAGAAQRLNLLLERLLAERADPNFVERQA